MSDLITPAAYSDKSTSYETTQATLDDFRKLTLNRNKNLGSLVVNGKGGLKCADHHVFRPLNGFGSVKPEDARRVRAAFVDAVTKELASRFDLLIKSEQMRNPENVEALKKKIGELNGLISDMFLNKGNDNPRSSAFAPLERKDVKSFIENIELLEKNATSERLLKMNAAKLLNLSDRVNRQEAEKYENQSWDQLSSIISNGVPPEEKSRTNAKKAYDNAVKAMKAANLEDLKKVGQDFLRATFPKIWEGENPEKFKAFNAAFADKGTMFVYLDEKGDLTFYDRANEREIRSHYEQLIEAVAHMEDEQVRAEELGGVPTKETIAKTLNDFADKLNTAKSEAEKAVAAAQEEALKKELSEKLGEALGNVTDREILRKATNAVLHRCDSTLVNLAKQTEGLETDKMDFKDRLKFTQCKGKFTSAFVRVGIDSFDMNDMCELKLAEGADINAVKKDVGRLLAALVGHNIVINGSECCKNDDELKALRSSFWCDQNDKTAVASAMREFIEELANSKVSDYHPIPNNEIEVDGDGQVEEPPVEEKKSKVKFKTDLDTINKVRAEGRAKFTEPLIPPEEEGILNTVEEEKTPSVKPEGAQGKSMMDLLDEQIAQEKEAKAAQKAQTANVPANNGTNDVSAKAGPKPDPIVSQVKPLTDMIVGGSLGSEDDRKMLKEALDKLYSATSEPKTFVRNHCIALEELKEFANKLSDGPDKTALKDAIAKFEDETRERYNASLGTLPVKEQKELLRQRCARAVCTTDQTVKKELVQGLIWDELARLAPGKLNAPDQANGLRDEIAEIAGKIASGDKRMIEQGVSSLKLKGLAKKYPDVLGTVAKGASLKAIREIIVGETKKTSEQRQAEFLKNEAVEMQQYSAEISKKEGMSFNSSAKAEWLWQKATDPAYQREAMLFFGQDVEPLTSAQVNETQGVDGSEKTTQIVQAKKNSAAPLEIETLYHSGETYYPAQLGMRDILFGRNQTMVQGVAGDTKNFFGFPWMGTHEEACLRCCSPVLAAVMIKKGYVYAHRNDPFHPGQPMYSYALNERGLPKVSAWRGYAIKAYMISVDGKPLPPKATPKSFWLVFGSATSLADGDSRDICGNAENMYFQHMDGKGGMNVPFTGKAEDDAELVGNYKAAYDQICNDVLKNRSSSGPEWGFLNTKNKPRVGYGRLSSDNSSHPPTRASEMLFLAAHYWPKDGASWNLLSVNWQEEIKKLYEFVKNAPDDVFKAAMEKAKANNERTIDWQYETKCKLFAATGAKTVNAIIDGSGIFKSPIGPAAKKLVKHANTYLKGRKLIDFGTSDRVRDKLKHKTTPIMKAKEELEHPKG